MNTKTILAWILTLSLLLGLCCCGSTDAARSDDFVLWAEPSGIKYMQDDDGVAAKTAPEKSVLKVQMAKNETEAKYKRNRPFWNGSQFVDIEYVLTMGLGPIVLMSPFLACFVAFILQSNRENNSEIDKIYNTVIEEPYRNQQSENGQ